MTKLRHRTSVAVHRVNEVTTLPWSAVAIACAVGASWLVIVLTGFDQDIQLGFATVCAGVTVTMVFVLQHTQRREQTAVQVKLNEILRALPRADDRLIGVESSHDSELVELEDQQLERHAALREDAPPRAR
jgi:low affinity Fe/Cu permease